MIRVTATLNTGYGNNFLKTMPFSPRTGERDIPSLLATIIGTSLLDLESLKVKR